MGAFLVLAQRSGVFRAVPSSLLLPLSDCSLLHSHSLSEENTWKETWLQDKLIVLIKHINQFSSVTQSGPTLWPHGLQRSRPPCPSPTPGAYSNSCLSSWWCHPTITSSVVPFSCLQSFPASGSFLRSQFFRWPKYWSFSFSISPSNEYSRLISLRIDWFGLLVVQGTLKSLLQHHSSKASDTS